MNKAELIDFPAQSDETEFGIVLSLHPKCSQCEAPLVRAVEPGPLCARCDHEANRRYHWRQYFLNLRCSDAEAAKEHRAMAEELEKPYLDPNPPPPKPKTSPRAQSQERKRWLLTPLINREQVRKFLLDRAKSNRLHKFNRVSEETLLQAHEMLRTWCIHHVNRFPSRGKTL